MGVLLAALSIGWVVYQFGKHSSDTRSIKANDAKYGWKKKYHCYITIGCFATNIYLMSPRYYETEDEFIDDLIFCHKYYYKYSESYRWYVNNYWLDYDKLKAGDSEQKVTYYATYLLNDDELHMCFARRFIDEIIEQGFALPNVQRSWWREKENAEEEFWILYLTPSRYEKLKQNTKIGDIE